MNKKYSIIITYLVLIGMVAGTALGSYRGVDNNHNFWNGLSWENVQKFNQELAEEAMSLDGRRNQIENDMKQLVERQRLGLINDTIFTREHERLTQALQQEEGRIKKAEDFLLNVGSGITNFALENARADTVRKTEVAKAVASTAVGNQGAMDRLKFIMQTDTLKKVGFLIPAVSLGIFAGWSGVSYTAKYLDAVLGMPKLIQESSRANFFRSLFSKVDTSSLAHLLDDIIFSEEIEKEVLSIAQGVAQTHEYDLQYRHMLLYGPPGTGKTSIAKKIAKLSGMDYAIISGADFSQFKPGVDIQKMHEIFDWAQHGKRGLILFIDEADALLRNRSTLSEQGISLVNAFLSRTNESSDKFMLILATNYPERLDSAVLSRINKKLEIPLPGERELYGMVQYYLKKYIFDDEKITFTIDRDVDDACIHEMAKLLDGASGRTIDQLVAEIRIESIIAHDRYINADLIRDVVTRKMAQEKKEAAWMKKDQAKTERAA